MPPSIHAVFLGEHLAESTTIYYYFPRAEILIAIRVPEYISDQNKVLNPSLSLCLWLISLKYFSSLLRDLEALHNHEFFIRFY
jgi:hypothetical protein